MSEQLLDADGVGEKLQVTGRTVRELASRGELPRGLRIGGSVRWRESEIDAWIARVAAEQVAALAEAPRGKRRA